MKTSFIVLFILFCSNKIHSQDCNCSTELEFVIKYYEANLPSFQDNVTNENRIHYDNLKEELLVIAKSNKEKNECFKIINTYVEFFKDNHSSVYMDRKITDDKSKSEYLSSKEYKKRKLYPIKKKQVKQYPQDDIRGIYFYKDSLFKVMVIADSTRFSRYSVIVLESKVDYLKKGDKILDLNPNKYGNYDYFIYNIDQSIQFGTRLNYSNGILGDFLFKTSLHHTQIKHNKANQQLDFKFLNDSTSYLKIPSFNNDLFSVMDSFYKKIDSQIQSKPYLIIDVRNNGGGSDRNVSPLLPYIYTKPFNKDHVEFYVTKDNIKIWENLHLQHLQDTANYDKEYLDDELANINRMKQAPINSFINWDDDTNITIQLDKVLTNPKQVAIMSDKGCASSCETLLFWAKESDKTIIVGENSGGYVGYGEVGTVDTPCYHFHLNCTNTRFEKNRTFEVIGIEPNFELNDDTDWIDQTMELLYSK